MSFRKEMDKFDWKLTIKTNILILKLVGLWPKEDETYKFNIYAIYSLFVQLVFVFGNYFFITVNIYFIIDDLQAVTAIMFVSLTEVTAIVKSYYLVQNMKILKQLMVTLNSEIFQPDSEQINFVNPTLNSWKTMYKLFSFMAFTDISLWAIFPVITKSVKVHKLPFPAWYPYDAKVSPFYELTYFYQCMSLFITCIVILNIDTLIAALNMYVGAQCDILCDKLRRVHISSKTNEEVINCVKHHKSIVKFAENSNRFFNWIVLLQFCVSALTLGISMFELSVDVVFSSDFYSHMFYLMASTVQIFMYCWFGNEVEIKSTNIPYAAFESDWTEATLEVKRNLIFFVLRSQKPIKVSALNLFYLTLETFVKILRASWSYFAVLSQINGEN